MAIDPRIPLMAVQPPVDFGQSLLQGLQIGQTISGIQRQRRQDILAEEEAKRAAELAPLRQRYLEAQTQDMESKLRERQEEAEIIREASSASKLLPFVQNKDIKGFLNALPNSGLTPEEQEGVTTFAKAGRWDELATSANSAIDVGTKRGLFGVKSSSGYTSSASQDIALLEEIQRRQQAGEITPQQAEQQTALIMAKTYGQINLGGGLQGWAQRGTPNVITPNIGGTSQVTPDVLRMPIEGSTQVPPAIPTREAVSQPSAYFGASPEEIIRLRDAAKSAGVTLGELEAKKIADLRNFEDDFAANVASLNAQFPELDLQRAVRDAPNTKISELGKNLYSVFMTNAPAAAEAKLESYLQSLAETVPFAPGAQSDAEYRARLERIGNIMKKGISSQEKLNMATDYLRGVEAKALEKRKQAEKLERKYFGSTTPQSNNLPAAGKEKQNIYEVDF